MNALAVVGQLFAASIDEAALAGVAGRLSGPLPWVALLPDRVRGEFVSEFQSVARACISVGRFERLTVLLEAWKSTAEAYADPSVTVSGDDLEYLETPEAVENPSSAA